MAQPLRYKVVVGLVFLGTALSAVGGWRYARASAPVSGPIILISVDSLRADRLPVYGYDRLQTPALEALAADGVVFERAYSHVPQTLPAHASILTGRLPFDTGVRDNAGFTLRPAERLLAEVLADRGYATAGIVSSYVLRAETGIAQGFSFFDGDMTGSPALPRPGLSRDGAASVAVAEKWLESAGTERAFVFLHLYEPHSPYAPPERFAAYPPYDGEIAYVDELVGRLIKYLKAHQLYDQSTIILLSDHGEGLGDHGESEHGLFVHEETLRVPLIIKPAAGEGAGRRVADIVQHVDIVPTILDLAKAPVPDNVRGRSLKPLLEGSDDFGPRFVYSESLYAAFRFGWGPLTTVTDGRFRLIRSPRAELYEVGDDDAPRPNALEDYPAELNALTAALERIAAGAPLDPPAATAPASARQLAALGYVGTPRPIAALQAATGVDPREAIDMVETYRAALSHAGARRWTPAIDLLGTLLRRHPGMADVWHQLGDIALLAGRAERAVEAYGRAAALRPGDSAPHIGAATALLRLRRFEEARRHAVEAQHAEPSLPLDGYIDGRLLYDSARYPDALDAFQRAIDDLAKAQRPPLPDIHYYAADTLVRLERLSEAEYHLLEELRHFPVNIRARGALASLYQQTGRTDEAADALAELIRVSPTPDAYVLAARLWTAFGRPDEAAAARAEAARAAGSSRRPIPAAQ